MKPDAPAEYRGIWKPIRTRVPGFDITELFPKQAKVTDKFSHRPLAAPRHRRPLRRRPSHADRQGHGRQRRQQRAEVPRHRRHRRARGRPAPPRHAGYVGVPHAASIGLVPGYFGGHMLGAQHNPFQTGGDPNAPSFQVQNLNLAQGLTPGAAGGSPRAGAALRHRPQAASTAWPRSRRWTASSRRRSSSSAARRRGRRSTSTKEDPRLRDRYGRHNWGQSTLLARRLVEAGCTFVTVHFGGWDHHWDLKAGMENYLPMVDSAVSRAVRATWTSAACWRRRWWCCAASSAGRRR